ncbi:YebC/PmpR family DNA-binding transcriptional regulator [Candidatus Falkowbacteria bacterium]|nr:YebC/PmpR family DNA-binding transcriptional regulator [Candidatus Falkowbacteria bacterium]
MSGHSRWHKVRQYKGGIDAKRATTFTKMARAVTVAARLGGGNPDFNFSLRLAIDRAKSVSVPKDVIERAIKKGTGELEGGAINEAVYEALGPGKVGMIIVCQTDNTNRALTEIKNVVAKHEMTLAAQGAVSWNFEKKGVIYLAHDEILKHVPDELEMKLIDAGALDILKLDEQWIVYVNVVDYGNALKTLTQLGITLSDSAIEYVAKETKELTPEQSSELEIILEKLDDLDDVDAVFHNAE